MSLRRRSQHLRSRRAFTLVEALIAMVVLSIGTLGLMSLQLIARRGKVFATNMATASRLAHDLTEQMSRWSYTDSRLTPLLTVTSTTDPAVTNLWDMGRAITVPSNLQAEYGEQANDPNAKTANALGTSYMGLRSSTTFYRYWNVFGLDMAHTGTAQGKLVQVIVRWIEPGTGMRQVAFSTYVIDPSALWQ